MTDSEREERILGLEPRVYHIACSRKRSLPPQVELSDLVSAGWLGAIAAVDHWKPAIGPLEPYADWRIRGHIEDYLRGTDPLSRDHRRAVKRGDMAEVPTLSLNYIRDDFREECGPSVVGDPRCAASARALDARLALERIFARAEAAMAMMPRRLRRKQARNRRILMLWAEGELQIDLARRFRVGESRISQVVGRAIAQLRDAA